MSASMKDIPNKTAVIGFPIAQSLSPLMHTHWFETVGMTGDYSALEVAPDRLADAIESMKSQGYAGFNITVPHKTAILPFLDKLAPIARQMGAVNTVKFAEDGCLTGFNTDGLGFVKHLNTSVPMWPRERPALVLGAGGAARAACLALINEKVPMVMITNRTREKAQAIADELGRGRMTVVDWADRNNAVVGAGLVVNTTVLGMTGQTELDLSLTGALRDTVVYDIVYKPLKTALLQQAENCGLRTVDGLGMLVHQGAAAFKIWFGADVGFDDELRNKLEGALA
jgi:shikimate dehydrogenase